MAAGFLIPRSPATRDQDSNLLYQFTDCRRPPCTAECRAMNPPDKRVLSHPGSTASRQHPRSGQHLRSGRRAQVQRAAAQFRVQQGRRHIGLVQDARFVAGRDDLVDPVEHLVGQRPQIAPSRAGPSG